MHISVIAPQSQLKFASDLLRNFSNVKFLRSPSSNSTVVNSHSSKLTYHSDAIVVIIDDTFETSESLKRALSLAIHSLKHNPQRIILPILLDGCNIPAEIEGKMHILCDSTSKKDIDKTRFMVEDVLLRPTGNAKKERQAKTSYMIVLTIAIELFAILFSFLPFDDFPFSSNLHIADDLTLVIVEMLSIVLALITMFVTYFSLMRKRSQEDLNDEVEKYSTRLRKALASSAPTSCESPSEEKNNIDAIGRMMINLEDIKEFYTWSQKQAKAAFYLSLGLCVAGFVLIAAAIVLPLVFNLSLSASILSAIGGVVTELMAATALFVYKNSLAQLNHYHEALHEDERFLSSVSLIGKFNNPETHDEMLKEIIQSEIQMNLLNHANAQPLRDDQK